MCTIFFLSPWNKKSSFVFRFILCKSETKQVVNEKRRKKMNLTPNDCWTTSSVPTWKESQFLKHKNSPTQLNWKKIFFPSLFSLSSNRKNQNAGNNLARVNSKPNKESNPKQKRSTLFFSCSFSNKLFFKHLQNQNQSRKPDPPKIKLNKKLDSHRLALLT